MSRSDNGLLEINPLVDVSFIDLLKACGEGLYIPIAKDQLDDGLEDDTEEEFD